MIHISDVVYQQSIIGTQMDVEHHFPEGWQKLVCDPVDGGWPIVHNKATKARNDHTFVLIKKFAYVGGYVHQVTIFSEQAKLCIRNVFIKACS